MTRKPANYRNSGSVKPPLGVLPERIWKEERLAELGLAIISRIETQTIIVPEWMLQYNALLKELQ